MGEFVSAALRFPVVLFTFLLLVVILYWLFVAIGASDVDALDGDGVGDGVGEGFGLGGVPFSIPLTMVITVAWFAALVGTVVLTDRGFSTTVFLVLSVAVLVGALVVALVVTRLVMTPLRKLFPEETGPSRNDFVGRACVVRTGRVDETFGQAEVTATDGSSAIVQVRQAIEHTLRAGDSAVIYDYDETGEFFWISPLDLDSPRT
jgi:hypothetical protein